MNNRRLKIIARGSLLPVLLLFMVQAANAQGICVHEDLVTKALEGRVVSKSNSGEEPIAGASIQLLEARYQGRVIAEAMSDATGVFKFTKKVKPGKYDLKVTYPQFKTYFGPVRFIKPGTESQEIVVTMGVDFTRPCGGTSAKVQALKQN